MVPLRAGGRCSSWLLCCVLSLAVPVDGAAVTPEAFADATLDNWQERSFTGHTRYRLVDDSGVRVLRADTDAAASILYRERTIDLIRTPVLRWQWKVAGVYDGIDERTRDGDDFPARLYVVARLGALPWQTLALNYVWASSGAIDDVWRNPFSRKAGMIAVRSGAADVGTWVREQRDVVADFRAVFGEQVERIEGYAVMVDGDNAGRSGTAWFGNITFSAQ